MKTKITRLTLLVLVMISGIFTGIASANPGILVTVNPTTTSAAAGSTVEYVVTVSNQDALFDKKITGVTVSSDWNCTQNPDITDQILPGGGSIQTTISLSVPQSASGINSHKVSVYVEYLAFPAPESGYSVFLTDTGPTQIPEFPTMALPVVSVLGLVLLMTQRKGRK